MKIDPRARPEMVCSTDATRFNLTSPYLDLSVSDEPRLVATDGHMMISIPVIPGPGDVSGYVPVAALKAARKLMGKEKVTRLKPKEIEALKPSERSVYERKLVAKEADLRRNGWKRLACDIDCSERTQVHVGEQVFPCVTATFPDWRSVVPKTQYPETAVSFIFNPRFLAALAGAMGVESEDGVRIRAVDSFGPLLVESEESVEGVVAILMPMRK